MASHLSLRPVLAALITVLILLPGAHAQEVGELAPAGAPETAEPEGVVRDLAGIVLARGKRTAVFGAKITIVELGRTDYTGDDGRFRFEAVPVGLYRVEVSASGYETKEFGVRVIETQPDEIRLFVDTSPVRLEEIVVRERKETPNVADQTLDREEVFSLPGAANDPVKAVTNLPGVAKTNPLGAVGGLVIRGTSQEESGYFLDSVTQPFLFHFGALTYTFNSELVQEVNYLPGGYGVRYGEALGGIVEVKSRRPRGDRIGGVVDLSTYSSFALVEGPINDEHKFALAFRRSFVDFVLAPLIPEDQAAFTVLPVFWDYEGMIDYSPNADHKVEFTVFGATDQIGVVQEEPDEAEPLVSGSASIFFTYHRQTAVWTWEPSGEQRNTLTVANLATWTDVELFRDHYLKTRNIFPLVREEYEHQLAPWNRLMVGAYGGVNFVDMTIDIIRPPKEGDPSAISLAGDDSYEIETNLWFAIGALYAQDEMDLGPYVRMTPGGRFTYLSYNGSWYADPRIFFRFATSDNSAIKLGLGQYHQFPSADELSSDLGNEDLEPENSYQANLGFVYDFPYAVSIDVQGFYKYLDNLVSPTDDLGADEPYENTGIGQIYGGELLVRKKLTDWWYAWISYSYTVSRRKDRDGADWRFFDQDQTHNFVVVASFNLPLGFKIGGKWQYATGTPYTDIVGRIYNADTDSYVPIYDTEINAERNADLHQLDVRVDKVWTFNTWELSAYLDVQNAYMRPQPFGYTYNFDYSERKQISFPLIIPSFGITARF